MAAVLIHLGRKVNFARMLNSVLPRGPYVDNGYLITCSICERTSEDERMHQSFFCMEARMPRSDNI